MKRVRAFCIASCTLLASSLLPERPDAQEGDPSKAASAIRVELNSIEPASQGRCRLTFVVSNTKPALASLKLDLAAFAPDGAIERRIAAEVGPLRADKTQVRAFDIASPCERVGSVLVNDVAGCAPAAPEECLERLELTYRGNVRLFK